MLVLGSLVWICEPNNMNHNEAVILSIPKREWRDKRRIYKQSIQSLWKK